MGAPDCGVKAKQHVDTTVGLSLASNGLDVHYLSTSLSRPHEPSP